MADDLPDMIYSDGMRLHQILRNLLSNAIKFTESGSVKLRVKKMNSIVTSDFVISGDVIAFSVEDTGIGIAAEHLQPIFEAFQQGEETTARRFGGLVSAYPYRCIWRSCLAGILPWRARKESGARLFYIYRC